MKTSVVLPLPPLPSRPLRPPANSFLAPPPSPIVSPSGPPLAPAPLQKQKPPLPPLPIDQNTLTTKIDHFLNQFVDKKNEKESLPKEFASGMCHGFDLMMMRADMLGERKKHLQRLHTIAETRKDDLKKSADLLIAYKDHFRKISESEKKAILAKNPEVKRFNLDYNVVRLRAINDMKMSENQKQMFDFSEDLYCFAHSLSAAHDAEKTLKLKINDTNNISRTINQSDILEILPIIAPDQFISKISGDDKKDDKKITRVEIPYQTGFKFNFPLSIQEIIEVIERTVFNGNLVSIAHPNHVMYFTKNNNKYVLYDSNFSKDPIEFNSASELVLHNNGIKNRLYDAYNIHGDFLPFVFNVIERNHSAILSRPTPSQFIKRFFALRQQEAKESQSIPTIEAKTQKGDMALHLAIKYCDFPCVTEAIAQGADVNAFGAQDWLPLCQAAASGSLPIVNALLAVRGILIDKTADDKFTALHYACFHNHPDVANALILSGADMTKVNEGNMTPLEMAAIEGHVECVKVLLENGAEFMSLFDAYPEVFLKALLEIKDTTKLHAASLQYFISSQQLLTEPLAIYVGKLFAVKKQEIMQSVSNAQNALGKMINHSEAAEVKLAL